MTSESLPHYLELRRQIDELIAQLAGLRAKENAILRQMFHEAEQSDILLQFDDKCQTIQWFDQSLKLGKKSYLFIKTLWQAPRHRKKTDRLEQSVWKSRSRKKYRYVTVKTKKGNRKVRIVSQFLSQNTLKLFLFRLQNRLRSVLFPYKIVPVKNGKDGEIVGYQLKCTKRYTKIQKKYPK